jgi:hypothetical protein
MRVVSLSLVLLLLCGWVVAPALAQKLRGDEAREARNRLRDIRRDWRDANKAEKYRLLQQLTRYPETTVTRFLEEVATSDEDHDVAAWAIYTIVQHGDASDLRSLLRHFSRLRDDERKVAFVRWLGGYGEDAPLEVLREAATEDGEIARAATHAIADAGTPGALDMLVDIANKARFQPARRAAAARLLLAGDARGVDALKSVSGLEQAAFAAHSAIGTELETKALEQVLAHARGDWRDDDRPHYFGSLLARLEHKASHDLVMEGIGSLRRHYDEELSAWVASVNRAGVRLTEVGRWLTSEDRARRLDALRALQRQPEPFKDAELEVANEALLPMLQGEDAEIAAHALLACIATGARADEAAELVAKWLEDENPELRAAALLATGQGGLSTHAERVTELLADDVWYVVSAALDCVLNLRLTAAAPAILEVAKRHGEGRLFGEALVLLEDLTGQRHGDRLELWEEWLGENETIEPAERVHKSLRGVPYRQMRQGTAARFYGLELLSTNIQFAIDRSVSMAMPVAREPERPDYPRRRDDILRRRVEVTRLIRDGFMPRLYVVATEVSGATEGLSATAHYGLTMFHHEFIEHPRIQNTPENRRQAYNWLISTEPQGGTDIEKALLQIIERADVDTILLLTDGDPLSIAILERIHRANAFKRINISVVSVHEEIFHRHYMNALARREYGQLVDAEPLEGFEDR